MKVDDLKLKTLKGDNTLKDKVAINVLTKAGFISVINDNILYTPLGLLLKNKVKNLIFKTLKEEGYTEIKCSSSDDLRNTINDLYDYSNIAVKSYKDIPFKIYSYLSIINHSSIKDSWNFSNREYLNLLDIENDNKKKDISSILLKKFLGEDAVINDYFCPLSYGSEYTRINFENNLDTKNSLLKLNVILYKYEYFGVVTLRDDFPSIEKVKRFLGITNKNIKFLSDKEIKEVFKISKGSLGPVRPLTDKLLIDLGIKENIPYRSGSNINEKLLEDIYLDKNFTGSMGDFTYNKENDIPGYFLGGSVLDKHKHRTVNKNGGFSYYNVNNSYIDVDKLILAIAENSLKKDIFGLKLKEDLTIFKYVVTFLDYREDNSVKESYLLYNKIIKYISDTIYDDRNISIGKKYRDYDLISIPQRIILKNDKLNDNLIEVRDRYGNIEFINKDKFIEKIKNEN